MRCLARVEASRPHDTFVHADRGLLWRARTFPKRGARSREAPVTAWCVLAAGTAKRTGLTVDPGPFDRVLAWIDGITDPGTLAVGGAGSVPPRTPEARLAAVTLTRLLIGERSSEAVRQSVERLAAHGPGREDRADPALCFFGTAALFRTGGAPWKRWEGRLALLVETSRPAGDLAGSWDPAGGGPVGGRTWTTALMALSTQIYYRYDNSIGVW